jgi:hypothetical protein
MSAKPENGAKANRWVLGREDVGVTICIEAKRAWRGRLGCSDIIYPYKKASG